MSTSDLHTHMHTYKHITEYTLYNMHMSAWILPFRQNVHVNLKQKFKNIQPLCNLQVYIISFKIQIIFCIEYGPTKMSNNWSNQARKEESLNYHAIWFKNLLQIYMNKNSMASDKKRCVAPWNQIEGLNTNLCIFT